MIHLGISGPIAAGKSTLAKSLKQLAMESGYAAEIIPFATGVRQVAALEKHSDIDRRAAITNLFYSWGYDYHLSLEAAALTDDYMRKYPTGDTKNRKLLQAIGTEVGRNLVDEDIWIYRVQRECLRKFKAEEIPLLDFLISDDLRFDNEAMAVDVHVGIDVQAHYEGYRNWNERIRKLGSEYTFSEHASEHALGLPPLFTIPVEFTQHDVLVLFEKLDRVRILR